MQSPSFVTAHWEKDASLKMLFAIRAPNHPSSLNLSCARLVPHNQCGDSAKPINPTEMSSLERIGPGNPCQGLGPI